MGPPFEERRAEILRLLTEQLPDVAHTQLREVLRYPGQLESPEQWPEVMRLLARTADALPEGDANRGLAPSLHAAAAGPNNVQALVDVGYELIELKAPAVAATVLARANELAPSNAFILGELVSALEHAMLYAEARRFLRDESDLLREDFLLRYLLAYYTLKSGDLTEGRQLVARVNPEQNHPKAALDQRRQMHQRLQDMLQSADAERASVGDRYGEIAVGGLYAVRNQDGSVGVWKVLAVDGMAVSLRKYSNKFGELPSRVDPASLTIGMDMDAFSRGDDGALGIGHLPLARIGFWQMSPVLIQAERVTDVELEGYRMWLDGAPPTGESSDVPSSTVTPARKKWWQFWK